MGFVEDLFNERSFRHPGRPRDLKLHNLGPKGGSVRGMTGLTGNCPNWNKLIQPRALEVLPTLLQPVEQRELLQQKTHSGVPGVFEGVMLCISSKLERPTDLLRVSGR